MKNLKKFLLSLTLFTILLLILFIYSCQKDDAIIEVIDIAQTTTLEATPRSMVRVCHNNNLILLLPYPAALAHGNHGDAIDIDNDGFFDKTQSCFEENRIDCDDNNFSVNPGAAEVCVDGVDNNCDGLIDSEDPVCNPCPNDGQDNINPTISCPETMSKPVDPGQCGAEVVFNIVTSDNCPGETILQTAGLESGSLFPVGTTTNTFEVTDASGNKATCGFQVLVQDNINPTISCPATMSKPVDPGQCGAEVVFNIVTSDNCPGETIIQTAGMESGSQFPMGTTTNTFEVTDASGNKVTCSFQIVVLDNINPTIAICQNLIIQVGSTGSVSITAADLDGGSTDNCGIESMEISKSVFTAADVGPNNVILTVADASGNTASCTAIVIVEVE